MNIEIIGNKNKKFKKIKLNKPYLIIPNFDSINQLKGNKILLEHSFQILKYTLTNINQDGKETN